MAAGNTDRPLVESRWRGWLRHWQRFWHLDRRQKAELARSACSLFYHQALVSYCPYRWWRKRLQIALTEPHDYSNSKPIASFNSLLQLHPIVAHHLPLHTTCLGRSLSLLTLLRRRGLHCVLRIGVKLADGQFTAHAWVESHHNLLNDRPENIAPYTLLTQCYTLPPLNH